MEREAERFWFPAKRYGWGWGPPIRWQGWAVLVVYALLLTAVAFIFLPDDRIVAFLLSSVVLTAALLVVCWLKGERPRWRP
jgi:hypothetical protein